MSAAIRSIRLFVVIATSLVLAACQTSTGLDVRQDFSLPEFQNSNVTVRVGEISKNVMSYCAPIGVYPNLVAMPTSNVVSIVGPVSVLEDYGVSCPDNKRGWTATVRFKGMQAGESTISVEKIWIDGSNKKSFVVKIVAPTVYSVSITDSPNQDVKVLKGAVLKINWDKSSFNSCVGLAGTEGWAGVRSRSGMFETEPLFQDTTFYMLCSGGGVEKLSSVTAIVGS